MSLAIAVNDHPPSHYIRLINLSRIPFTGDINGAHGVRSADGCCCCASCRCMYIQSLDSHKFTRRQRHPSGIATQPGQRKICDANGARGRLRNASSIGSRRTIETPARRRATPRGVKENWGHIRSRRGWRLQKKRSQTRLKTVLYHPLVTVSYVDVTDDSIR
jgi:hypothetical protein